MKVYVDVTNLLMVDFLTGIQRVVREVVVRMLKNSDFETVLLCCNKGENCFRIVNTAKFLDRFTGKSAEEDNFPMLWNSEKMAIPLKNDIFDFPIFGGPQKGTFVYHFNVKGPEHEEQRQLPLIVI